MKNITSNTLFVLLIGCMLISTTQTNAQPQMHSNPIVPGYAPDPSICRHGEDYYLVNSSFEWFPGIPIYYSKDLVNWRLINYAVSNPKTFVIGEGRKRNNDTYAPTIRFHKGLFYVICTGVGGQGNFFVTAENPMKEWSDPVWIKNAEGIDPEIFWDDDGRTYYLGKSSPKQYEVNGKLHMDSVEWDGQSVVYMQEINMQTGELFGKKEILTHGHATNARWTEGPHLFKRNGKYMLMAAEGGTDFHHATVVFHSDNLWGPYVPEHTNPVFTMRHLGADYPVWAVGHTDLFQTQKGDWWAVMHCKRKVDGISILARETCITPVKFDGNTPVFNPGVGKLSMEQNRPDLPWTAVKPTPSLDDFDGDHLALEWNFLRTPVKPWHVLKKGKLVLEVRPRVIEKFHNASFVARRVLNHRFTASTSFEFSTEKDNEKAGLVIFRSQNSHIQLVKSGKTLQLINTTMQGKTVVAQVPYSKDSVMMKMAVDGDNMATFSYSDDAGEWTLIGEPQNLFYLADEAYVRYNGLMVGMYASSGDKASKAKAYFDWFKYE